MNTTSHKKDNVNTKDEIMRGLIIALNAIKDIEHLKPKRYILEMRKRIISDIRYLEGGNQSGKY